MRQRGKWKIRYKSQSNLHELLFITAEFITSCLNHKPTPPISFTGGSCCCLVKTISSLIYRAREPIPPLPHDDQVSLISRSTQPTAHILLSLMLVVYGGRFTRLFYRFICSRQWRLETATVHNYKQDSMVLFQTINSRPDSLPLFNETRV